MASTTVSPNSTTTFSIKAVHNDKSPISKGALLSQSGSSCRPCVLVSSARTFPGDSEKKKPNSNIDQNNHQQQQDHLIPQVIGGSDTVPLIHKRFGTDSTATATATTTAEIEEEMGEDSSFFRSMTFNLRYDTPRDGPNVWDKRKHLVASTVHFHRPDVMGVQEAKHNQMEDLNKSLPGYGWVGVGRDDGAQAGEYCAIFYRKRKFDSVDSGTFWLSESPDRAGSKSWGSACVRICTWTRLKFKSGGSELFVFNAHLDHESSHARVEAAALISRHIPVIVQRSTKQLASTGPVSVIVMGDFNDFPSSPPYNALVNSTPPLPEGAQLPDVLQFKDSRATAKYKHNADAGSFTDWIRPEQHAKPQILIDYILYYGNLEPETYGIICELFGDKQASDHRPVVSDFHLMLS